LKDHVSALALYDRAQTYLDQLAPSKFIEQDIPVSEDDIATLATTLKGELTRSHVNVVLSQPTFEDTDYLKKVRIRTLELT
jgi:hypothetical protein